MGFYSLTLVTLPISTPSSTSPRTAKIVTTDNIVLSTAHNTSISSAPPSSLSPTSQTGPNMTSTYSPSITSTVALSSIIDPKSSVKSVDHYLSTASAASTLLLPTEASNTVSANTSSTSTYRPIETLGTASTSVSPATHPPTAAIIGAVVGLIVLATMLFVFMRRHRQRSRRAMLCGGTSWQKMEDYQEAGGAILRERFLRLGSLSPAVSPLDETLSSCPGTRSHSPFLDQHASWAASTHTLAATLSPLSLDIALRESAGHGPALSKSSSLREEIARERRGVEEHVAELQRRHGSSGAASRVSANTQSGEETAPGYGVDEDDNAASRRQMEYLLAEIERLRAIESALADPPPAYDCSPSRGCMSCGHVG